jgi:hypothetical protein
LYTKPRDFKLCSSKECSALWAFQY